MKAITSGLLVFICTSTLGQTEATDSTLTNWEYNYLMVKHSRLVSTEGNSAGPNRYVALDLNEAKGTLNWVFLTEQGSNFNIKVNSGLSDGLLPVFQQSKLNTDLSVNLGYTRLLKSFSSVYYYGDNMKQFNTSHKIDRDSLIDIDNQISQLRSGSKNDQTKIKIKELKIKRLDLQTKYAKTLDEFEFNRIKFITLQAGFTVQNNSFNLFDSKFSDLDSQIVRKQHVSYSGNLQFNRYSWSTPRRGAHSWYFLVGTGFTYLDNFSDLNKLEITDVNVYTDSLTSRTISKEITAYQGDYESKLLTIRVYSDLYIFDSQNKLALHIYPEIRIKQNQEAVINAGLGLYYSFPSKENQTSKVNTEVYMQWNDLSNVYSSSLSTFKRSEVGVRFSIPISFINL